MCIIPKDLTIEELEYVLLLVELDPNITTTELLALLQERRDSDDTMDNN